MMDLSGFYVQFVVRDTRLDSSLGRELLRICHLDCSVKDDDDVYSS